MKAAHYCAGQAGPGEKQRVERRKIEGLVFGIYVSAAVRKRKEEQGRPQGAPTVARSRDALITLALVSLAANLFRSRDGIRLLALELSLLKPRQNSEH